MQMIKRTLSILLTVVMLVTMFSMVNVASAAAWDGTVATEFESGSGIEADPYIIIDAAQLAYMNAVIGDGTQASAYFKLGADITLNEGLLDEDYNVLKTPSVSWDSQGTFSGVFDGNGKTIYGFYTKKSGSGLFNEVTGTIKNLTMKDAYVNMNWTSHGILASVMTGATIDKVEIDGFMTGKMSAGGHNRGMMAGSGYATFTNCIVMGKSLATGDAMATQGAGYLGNVGGETSFTNCINYADIEGFAMAGGFVAITGNTVNFTDCINYGVIKTGTAYSKWSSASNNQHSSEAGGFVGAVWAANVNITRCANEGAITGDSYAGGFVGVVLNSKTPVITINNAYNVGIITCIGTSAETSGIQYSGDFVAHQYVGTYNSSSTGAGDLTAYQAGAWLGDGADRWAYGQAMNPYLTYFGTVGHVHSYTESGTEPTCTEGGQTVYTCGCGFSYTVEKAALGHDYVEEIITPTSCAKEGLTSFTCSRCDDSYTETIPTVDHGYVLGYCVYCGAREEYTPIAAEWAVDFVDANGNEIDTISTANGEFWMVFRLTNYADRIGEMNSTGDLSTSTYDRTIAVASLFVAMDNSEIIGVRENNKIVYATPYDTATLTTNYDTTDGMLKAIFLSDENAGCTFSVGKSALDANNGELFRIKVKSKLTEAGEISVKLVEESEYAASSVALVNKPEAGEWVNGTVYSVDLVFDSRCYDTIYKMNVTADEAPHEHAYTEATTDATCTEDGKIVYTCTCGDSYTETIPAKGHTKETKTVDATCTADGSITVTCTVCGETISTEVIEATGHSYVDGTCENCGEADPDAPQGPTYVESMTIPGFNVKFESDYSVYVYVPKTITNQYATVKVIASKAMYDGDTFTGYSDVELTEGISQGDYMLYEYAGFAAKEIASEIKAHIVAIDADGNEFYGPEKNYSLQSYALNKIKNESTPAKFRTMMVDFVNYGAAAQVYFSYNTTALANVGAEDYQNLATPTRAYEKHTANTADTSYATQIKGFNLQFLNKVHIYGYVDINGQDIEDIKANWYGEATYVDAGGKSQTQRIDLSEMFAQSGYYLFSFNNLFSKEMSIPVTFTLYNAEGEQMSNAATYSIESYANSKGSGTDKLAKLTQALMSFGDAASAYFKK